jgi:hypothetical protein
VIGISSKSSAVDFFDQRLIFQLAPWRRPPLPDGALGGFLRIRRIIRSASRAKNREIVDLALLGMQQDDTAFPAGKINRVIARIENWRGADELFQSRPRNRPETDLTVCGHGFVLHRRGLRMHNNT